MPLLTGFQGYDLFLLTGWVAIIMSTSTNGLSGKVACLASPEAAFVTGANLTIDGGFAA